MTDTSAKRRRQRAALFALQGGRCFWCGASMTLPAYPPLRHRRPPANEATIDHLDSRWSPERGRHNGESRHVLACWDCNGRRNTAEQASIPRAELWRRSGRAKVEERLRPR